MLGCRNKVTIQSAGHGAARRSLRRVVATLGLACTYSFVLSAAATAEFLLDVSAGEVDRFYNNQTIAGLAVNESSFVYGYRARLCTRVNRLFIGGGSQIGGAPDPLSGYIVKRLPDDRVELQVHLELRAIEDLRKSADALVNIGAPPSCEWLTLVRPTQQLFEVQSVDGFSSLSELVNFNKQNAADIAAGISDLVPHWADQRYPDIDYSADGFYMARYGYRDVYGHWMVRESTAEIDDSTTIMAETFAPPLIAGVEPRLLVQCIENETRILFMVDERLRADSRSYRVNVEYRLDSEPPRSERWGISTSEKSAGIWGDGAPEMIRTMIGHDSLYIRVTDNRNRRFDETFDIRGIDDVAARVAAACGWSTLSLTRSDYMAIQRNLRGLGLYDGAIDGAWGPMSQAAMRAFQDANGLAVTGVPDKDSLNLLEE